MKLDKDFEKKLTEILKKRQTAKRYPPVKATKRDIVEELKKLKPTR